MKTTRTKTRKSRGTQTLELALVLPLLFFLSFVVSEGAAFVRVHQVINNAAREGAHYSSLFENQTGDVTVISGVVKAYATNNGVDATKLTVTVNQSVPVLLSTGVTVYMSQVTVTYPYPLKYLPALPGFSVPNTVTLKGFAEFRNLY